MLHVRSPQRVSQVSLVRLEEVVEVPFIDEWVRRRPASTPSHIILGFVILIEHVLICRNLLLGQISTIVLLLQLIVVGSGAAIVLIVVRSVIHLLVHLVLGLGLCGPGPAYLQCS